MQSGVQAGFGLSGGSGIDSVPVSPSKSVQVGNEGMPNVNLTNGDVNHESR
jgi:hypothetical protein